MREGSLCEYVEMIPLLQIVGGVRLLLPENPVNRVFGKGI